MTFIPYETVEKNKFTDLQKLRYCEQHCSSSSLDFENIDSNFMVITSCYIGSYKIFMTNCDCLLQLDVCTGFCNQIIKT